MGPILGYCAAALVAASLLVVLVYGVLFTAATVATARARRRPDEVSAALDGFLADLLGAEVAGTHRH